MTALTVHSTSNVYYRNSTTTESERKSATAILCFRAATNKQLTSQRWKSVIYLFSLDCFFPDWVSGRILGPVLTANERRQGTVLDKSKEDHRTLSGCLVPCSGVLAPARCPTSKDLSQEFCFSAKYLKNFATTNLNIISLTI